MRLFVPVPAALRVLFVTTALASPVAMSLVMCGCGSASDYDGFTQDASTADLQDSPESSLTLTPSSLITLVPGDSIKVLVELIPARQRLVRFALVGESLDAFLDETEKYTDEQGQTFVILTAPKSACSFRLRASVDTVTNAEVPVSVSSDGFAGLKVLPVYKGIRKTPVWTASASPNISCGNIVGQIPTDGPLMSTAPDGKPVVLKGLPVGPPVAVVLRAEKSVAGCVDVPALAANEKRDLTVKVSDIPPAIEATKLDVTVDLQPDGLQLYNAMHSERVLFVDTVFPPSQSLAKTLLHAMRQHATSLEAFDLAATEGQWEKVLTAQLPVQRAEVAALLTSWIERGFEPLKVGALATAQLLGDAKSSSHAFLNITSAFGMDVRATSIEAGSEVSIRVEPGDVMIVGGEFAWMSSDIVAAAGHSGAQLINKADAISALTATIDCQHVSTILVATGKHPSDCDASCLEKSCVSAVEQLWNKANNASPTKQYDARITFTVSGTAQVDGQRTIASFGGQWVGTHTQDSRSLAVRGNASATSTVKIR